MRTLDDRKRTFLRGMKTRTGYRYGMGGLPKTVYAPKPVTLPKLKCLEDKPPPDNPPSTASGESGG